jgi:hypothetical protein
MQNSLYAPTADKWYFGHIGWRHYNYIRKKAMEQEFSYSGLLVNLSIAFFVVIGSALALSSIYELML